jgi:hypothetical protein
LKPVGGRKRLLPTKKPARIERALNLPGFRNFQAIGFAIPRRLGER